MDPAAQPLPCAFCGTPAASPRCSTCQRDPRAPRRVCKNCHKQTPTAEPRCMHCQVAAGSDMSWKVPLIIVMFVLAFVLAVALQSVR
jgi:hypothetical protein